MTMKLFANYGLLAHEKETVYSKARGEICDEITVELPEGWKEVELVAGMGLESPWGWMYWPEEVIRCISDSPWIDVRDSSGNEYRRKLRIV